MAAANTHYDHTENIMLTFHLIRKNFIKVLGTLVVTITGAIADERVTGIGEISTSTLYGEDLHVSMVVNSTEEEFLSKITINLTNQSDSTYRLALPGHNDSIKWGMFITNLNNRREYIDKTDLTLDFDKYYEVYELRPGEVVSWNIETGKIITEPLPAKDVTVSFRMWLANLQEKKQFTYMDSRSDGTGIRLIWRGS